MNAKTDKLQWIWIRVLVLLTVLIAIDGRAGEPFGVFLLDDYFDFEHPVLRPHLNIEALRNFKVDTDSWWDLNEASGRDIVGQLPLDTIHRYGLVTSLPPDVSNHLIPLKYPKAFRVLTDEGPQPGFERKLKLTDSYLHGTHVAGLIVRGQEAGAFSLYPLAMPGSGSTKKARFEKVLANARSDRSEMSKMFGVISEAIKSSKSRIANLSLEGSAKILYDSLKDSVRGNMTRSEKVQLKSEAEELARVYRSGFESVVTENPETLFFLAAGNNGRNLSKVPGSVSLWQTVRRFNLITVGALRDEMSGSPLPLSNFGKPFVRLFAPGREVLSARAGGGALLMTGTSMASPQAASVAVSVLSENPSLDTKDLRRFLFRNHTKPMGTSQFRRVLKATAPYSACDFESLSPALQSP